MTNGLDLDWDALVADWKSNDTPSPALAKRVKRGTWAAYGGIASGLLALSTIVAATWPTLMHGGPPVHLTVDVFVLALGTALVVAPIRMLLGTLRPEAQTTRAFVDLEKRRSQGELRAVVWLRRAVLAMLAFDAVWLPWKVYADRVGYAAEPWRLVEGSGWHFTILALLWVGSSFARRKHEARLAALEELAHAGRED
jgi:hypothetical protein